MSQRPPRRVILKNDKLFRYLPHDETSKSKAELVTIINEQARELSAIMGLLDGYGITRDNLSCDMGTSELTPYGRVLAAMQLLDKTGHVESDSGKDVPDAYAERE